MIKYDTYKDSGIEWLGEIPEHWEIKRVKDVAKTKSGTTPLSKNLLYYNGIYNWIRTTDLNNGHLYSVEFKITELALIECNMSFLPIDTLLIAMYGGYGTIGKNSLLKKESTINQSVCAIIPNVSKFDSNYFFYFLKFFRKDWVLFAEGTRKDPNINQDSVKNLFTFFPPLSEQTQIANYLDSKTKAIDQKINLLTQKTEKYKELRKAIINQTVTKGLDKNVTLKDSGIEWIGEIPKHWEVKRLKSFGNIETSSVNKKIEEDEKIVKLVNYTDVFGNSNKEIWNNNLFMKVSAKPLQIISKTLIKGDVLFTPSSETIEDIGVSAVIMENLNNTLYSYHTLRLRFAKNVYLNFKKYLFNNDFVQGYLSKNATGTTRKILGLRTFNNLLIIIPDTIKEQTTIANYLDEKTSKIDAIVNNIEKQINTLKELRKTLINDAVTGKIKVI